MKKLTYKNTLTACYLGYITQAIVVNFMPILFIVFQDEFGISFTDLGGLVLLNFVTQIIVDVIATRYIDKIGFRRAVVPAHIFSALGLICLGFLPGVLPDPYVGLVISVIIFSFGGGLIEVVISPVVDFIPSEDNSASMSLLHSFYCWGQLFVVLITTIVLRLLGYASWRVLALCWALIPIFNIFYFMRVPLPDTCPEERQSLRTLFTQGGFLLALLLMIGSGASEQIMAQWSSLFAQKGLGVSKVMGDLLGPCLFALFMAVGRMWYGIKGEKIDLKKALLFCSILCIGCYLAAVFFSNPLISLAACALTGFSVSIMWPGVLSFTSARFPKGGAAMFGVMAIFGDVGCSVGPWLAGLISDSAQKLPQAAELAREYSLGLEQVGLKAGILIGVVFPVIMVFGLLVMRKKKS